MRYRRMMFIFFTIFTIIIFYYCYSNNSKASTKEENVINHFAIHSAFYYNTSKLYSSNTMIVLLNTHKDIHQENIIFQCYSQNQTSNLTSIAQMRTGDSSGAFCSWRSYLVNCTAVLNPDSFGLTTSTPPNIVNLAFEYPSMDKYPVIMCYPQMVYESRWQQIIFATEIYRQFGADLQVQYVNSAMEKIVDLLEVYERKGWVKIRRFGYTNIESTMISSIKFNPMLELDSRNQAMAYTDCLMKYRESAEFVIVADVDDILIPKYPTFYKEFIHWTKLHPFSAAYMYFRVDAKVKTRNNFADFSLSDIFESFKVDNLTYVGKSVLRTELAEMAWIHWPGLDNSTTATIWSNESKFYHTFIETDDKKSHNRIFKPYNFLSPKSLKRISFNFVQTFQNFSSFKSNNVYAESISKCYLGLTWDLSGNKTRPCLTPLQCPKPKELKGFKCKVAKRKTASQILAKNIVFHYPDSEYRWVIYDKGCVVF